MESKNIRQNHISKIVSVTKQSVNRWFHDAKDIGAYPLYEIKSKYPDLNLEWVIMGDGNMLTDHYESPTIFINRQTSDQVKCQECDNYKFLVKYLEDKVSERDKEIEGLRKSISKMIKK